MGPTNGLDVRDKKNIPPSYSIRESNPGCQARNSVTVPNELSWLHGEYNPLKFTLVELQNVAIILLSNGMM
jgi:hypothetical protein